jgi:hypothetical protein
MSTSVAVPYDEEFVEVVMWPHAESPDSEEGLATTGSGGTSLTTEVSQSIPDAGRVVPSDPVLDEYADWVKQSRATGLEYGKNMLTTSSGAVAVYFAVLKYLGFENVSHSPTIYFTVFPSVLFTLATAAFAVALKPGLARVNRDGFRSLRDKRLASMNRFLAAGTTILVLGLAFAVVVYVYLILVK